MAETPAHWNCLVYGVQTLTNFYADRDDVWVGAQSFLYYEENNPRARVAPDLYVVFGVPKNTNRNAFFVWLENKTPSVIFEYVSRPSKFEDAGRKKDLYERVLCVSEYFLLDPKGECLAPKLRGYRLINGKYAPIAWQDDRLHSEVLGLEIEVQSQRFRFYDPARQKYLESYQELMRRLKATERNNGVCSEEAPSADEEATRHAEAETARLRALIAQMTRQTDPKESEGEA